MFLKVYHGCKIVVKENLENYEYKKAEFLRFTDEYGNHFIDLKNKKYEKNDKDIIFTIDFVNNLGIIIVNGDKEFNFDTKCYLKETARKITLQYKMDEEIIKIEIDLEEWRDER